MSFKGTNIAVRIFVLLQIVLVLLGLFQIGATVYLSLYGPRDAISGPSRILTLVASTLSIVFSIFRWQLSRSHKSKTLQAWSRDVHPASVLFLCILLCLWIAAEPTAIIKAFDHEECKAATETVRGLMQPSTCLLDKIKAILAAVMAAITFALLLLLTCFSSLFPQPCPCKAPETKNEQSLPSHFRDTSFRSFSDSQTLRPSYDVDYLYPKMRPPIMPRPQTHSRFNLLPKLPPFDQLTPLDLDHPSLRPAPLQDIPLRSDIVNASVNTSQACLLPSPLALSPMAPLPLRPTRMTSMGSHPPLSRSHTGRTVTSSIYSRSVSTDELFSRQPSPMSSMCDSPNIGIAGDIRLQTKSPARPPTPHNQHPQPTLIIKPVRPQSRPGMPPPSFWMYAQRFQEEQDSSPDKTVTTSNYLSEDDSRFLKTDQNGHAKNTKSMSHVATVSTDPYERYRKGPRSGSPLWSGKSDFDRRLAAAITETKIATDRSVQRAKTSGGKVTKSQWPSTAF